MSFLNKPKISSDKTIFSVIMSGGHGTRFWPASRKSFPKQYLNIAQKDKSLIESTIDRFTQGLKDSHSLILTSNQQVEIVKKQIGDVPILAEPMAKNTAVCLLYCALTLQREYGDTLMVVTPADHYITPQVDFEKIIKTALNCAEEEDALITTGIVPSSPHTGYGYIRRGAQVKAGSKSSYRTVYEVSEFVEKPDFKTALEYLENGDYYWNSGIFCWRTSVFIDQAKKCLPELYQSFSSILSSQPTEEQLYKMFEDAESISVDYGIMEKAQRVLVVEGSGITWSDVGSWSSWLDHSLSTTDSENVGEPTTVFIDSSSCGHFSNLSHKEGHITAFLGLENTVLVQTENATLVCNKDSAEDVKKLTEILKKDNLIKYL